MKEIGALAWSFSEIGKRVNGGRDWGVIVYAVKMYLACGLMLTKKLLSLMTELVLILNYLGSNVYGGHKKWPILCKNLQKWTIENKRICRYMKNFKTYPNVTILLPCGRHKCMAPYMFAVYEFSVLEKITILMFGRNKPIIKIMLKDISMLYKCGSSVKVNDMSYNILWNFMWQNAAKVYIISRRNWYLYAANLIFIW